MNDKLGPACIDLILWFEDVDWIQLIQDWQTLITGLLALAAAWMTVSQMKKQMAEDRNRHVKALDRQAWAARAQMPDALSEFAQFCRNVVLQLNNETAEMPPLPTEGIETLKLVITHIDNNASHRVFELLGHYQVHNARLNSLISSGHPLNSNSPDWTQALYDVSLLQAQVNSLYDYGRNNTEKGPEGKLTVKDIKAGMTNAIGLVAYLDNEERYKPTVDMITRIHAASVD